MFIFTYTFPNSLQMLITFNINYFTNLFIFTVFRLSRHLFLFFLLKSVIVLFENSCKSTNYFKIGYTKLHRKLLCVFLCNTLSTCHSDFPICFRFYASRNKCNISRDDRRNSILKSIFQLSSFL